MLVEPHYPQSHQQFHTVDNITNKGKKRKFVLSFQLSMMKKYIYICGKNDNGNIFAATIFE